MKNRFLYLIVGCVLIAVVFIIVRQMHSIPDVITKHEYDELLKRRDIKEGQYLYEANCIECHSLSNDIDGPQLIGIEDRVLDRKVLRAWIKNSKTVIESGEEYFVKVDSLYHGKMPMFPHFTDDEIDYILDFVKVSSAYEKYKNNLEKDSSKNR